MQTQIKKIGNNFTWINIIKPEILEIKKILTENNLSDSLAEEIVRPTSSTKVDSMRNSVYLTLHFPIFRNGKSFSEEVDFLIKSNLLISSSYNEIQFIKDYIQNHPETDTQKHGGNIFCDLLDSIYKQIKKEVEKSSDDIKALEENIFTEDERRGIENISRASKRIFDLRSKLKSHAAILEIFQSEANKIFGFEFDEDAKNLNNSLHKILIELDNQKENIDDLKDTFDFLLTNKTNQIVKVFTVVSFILLPVTFLAGFFGMNTHFPQELVTSEFGTIYIMLIMLTVSVATLSFLHWKKFI
jgi:magnesium transporter